MNKSMSSKHPSHPAHHRKHLSSPHPPPPPPPSHTHVVQEVPLASLGAIGAPPAPSAADVAAPLPPPQLRPSGPLTLAGVRHSYLWLADAAGRPFILSLRHPGLRLRCLAARGELSTARTIAERGEATDRTAPSVRVRRVGAEAKTIASPPPTPPSAGLSPAFHDDVARFLVAMAPAEGVKEALLLPGLSSAAEMALSIRAGKCRKGWGGRNVLGREECAPTPQRRGI
jgi:hypothetical protein